jgi:putative Mg2+ transporter-C (MgtC) family protein
MESDVATIVIRIGAAWLAGSLIGIERSYREKPAGFRTHSLVCLASALLMTVTTHQWQWIGNVPLETLRADPQRIAQGIMTGIGFLGAGAIFRERLIVRGLTTAASVWMTAALGILYGVGFYAPAILGTVLTLVTLIGLRVLEHRLPMQMHALHELRFAKDQVMHEDDVRALLAHHAFEVVNMSYRQTDAGRRFEYRMIIHTRETENLARLARTLSALPNVREFRISPAED